MHVDFSVRQPDLMMLSVACSTPPRPERFHSEIAHLSDRPTFDSSASPSISYTYQMRIRIDVRALCRAQNESRVQLTASISAPDRSGEGDVAVIYLFWAVDAFETWSADLKEISVFLV
jgi:hypothetical protein